MAKDKQVMRVKGGSAVQQDRLVQFTFDGKSYMGCAGDTLASALLANNVHLVGRSFKYHRPRGIMAAGVEEANAQACLSNGLLWFQQGSNNYDRHSQTGWCVSVLTHFPSPAIWPVCF